MSDEKSLKISLTRGEDDCLGKKIRDDGSGYEAMTGIRMGMLIISLLLFALCAFPMLFSKYDSDVPGIILSIVTGLMTLFTACLTVVDIKELKNFSRIKANQPVKPNCFTSIHDIFALSVGFLSQRVDTLIERWNCYCEMREIAYMDPLLNEDALYESLRQLREETSRHVRAAKAVLKMKANGEFIPQVTGDDSVMESLEHVRELEDQLQRTLNWIGHRLHSPLAVAANVALLEAEMDREMKVISLELEDARITGRQFAIKS